jgi:type IV pilus assembly protein PilM
MFPGASFHPPIVGLDIGSSSVKAVVLQKRTRRGWKLVAAGDAPLPAGRPGNRHAHESEAISEVVSGLFDALRLRRARVAAALAGHAVIVKRLSLPAMTQAELADAIPWEAEQYIPFDLADVRLDYQVLETPGDNGTRTSLDVLLVAAKRDRVDDRAATIAQTGRRPAVIDVEAFALANAYEMNHPDRTDPLVALVHIGRSTTIVCLLEHGDLVFTRDIAIGGQLHLEAILHELGPSGADERAATRMLHRQVPSDLGADRIAALLHEASAQLVADVRKTIDFYLATAPAETLSRLVVSGGACQAAGLMERLTSEFSAPVDVFDPFRRIARPSRTTAADASGPAYAIAVGLAMREEHAR